MKNKKMITSSGNHQMSNFNKKECEVLNDGYFEFYVLCAIRRNLIKAVELAQQNNMLYSRNTIYIRKRIKLVH